MSYIFNQRMMFILAGVALVSQLVQPAFADADIDSARQLANDYPTGTIASSDEADQALRRASQVRSEVEQRFAHEQRACYSRFFATACLDDARETRRIASNQVKRVEIEAGEFQRRTRATERDRAVAEKSAKEKADAEKAPKNDRVAEHEAKLKQLEAQDRADAQKRESNIAAYDKKVRDAEERRKKAEEKRNQPR